MIKGFVRRLDHLGRVTIPKEYRRSLEIPEGASLDIKVDGKVIRLHKGRERKLDELGRYTLPVEIRRTLKLRDQELVDICLEGEDICIRKASIQCVMCGSEDEKDLTVVDGFHICKNCGMKVADKFKEVNK
jgi:transcriptional pleiotropic regulator of transition state genes